MSWHNRHHAIAILQHHHRLVAPHFSIVASWHSRVTIMALWYTINIYTYVLVDSILQRLWSRWFLSWVPAALSYTKVSVLLKHNIEEIHRGRQSTRYQTCLPIIKIQICSWYTNSDQYHNYYMKYKIESWANRTPWVYQMWEQVTRRSNHARSKLQRALYVDQGNGVILSQNQPTKNGLTFDLKHVRHHFTQM